MYQPMNPSTQRCGSDPTGRRLDRRSLLGGALAAGALGALAPPARAAVRLAGLTGTRREPEEPALVLLQLTGGNDGLSTVVPHADPAYARRRGRLAIADPLDLDGRRGLHPALRGLAERFRAGRLAIVEGVGYPNPVRSHFKSMDVWHAASPRGRGVGEGWVGRLVGSAFPGARVAELVVHIGKRAPFSLYARRRAPIAFEVPEVYRWLGDEVEREAFARAARAPQAAEGDRSRRAARDAGAGRDATLDELREVLAEAQASSDRIRRAVARYEPRVAYPREALGASLRTVAALLDGGLGCRVLSVELSGFDTHTDQRERHDALMERLDSALSAFTADLTGRPHERAVALLAFSEFGRRVAPNASGGTDHGQAGPMLLLGAPVRGGFWGEPPSLEDLDDGDLAFTTDFRRVYASAIRWLGGDVEAVLGEPFEPLECL